MLQTPLTIALRHSGSGRKPRPVLNVLEVAARVDQLNDGAHFWAVESIQARVSLEGDQNLLKLLVEGDVRHRGDGVTLGTLE